MAHALCGYVRCPLDRKPQGQGWRGKQSGGKEAPRQAAVPRRGLVELLGGPWEGQVTFNLDGERRAARWFQWSCKDMARCGQQEGDEKEVSASAMAWTQGGDRQVTVSQVWP